MNNINFKDYIEQKQPNRVALLHHWDADGLASAALVMNYLKANSPQTKVSLHCPTINNYFFKEQDYHAVSKLGVDAIIIVDLNIPLDNIERFEQICDAVFVFDHHSQTAGIDRPGKQDTSYPGCSMLVNDCLDLPLSITAIIGMVGDQPETIFNNQVFWPYVEEVMKKESLQFHDLKKIANFVDTMYILYDIEGFSYAIGLLQSDPVKILSDDRFFENEKQIMAEMSKNLEQKMDEFGVNILQMSIQSNMSVLSEVTRYKAKKHPKKIVVIDQVRDTEASLYVRRTDLPIDLGEVVQLAKKFGYNAGGKPEVAGIVLPAEKLSEFRKEVIDYLQNK
ncbi:MAG: hypothetical protein KKG04_02625 [Candidatus Thermoplasmatota archaeon]|nr:hypothetical protein [Candidatus Thermoplasmatota archaeon]